MVFYKVYYQEYTAYCNGIQVCLSNVMSQMTFVRSAFFNRRVHRTLSAIIGLILCLTAASCSRLKEVPYVATPPSTVDAILELAEVSAKDVVYDLGAGDGRIVITAAKRYGARGVGVEIDPQLVAVARENARRQGVEHLVEIRQEDVLDTNFSEATVVTLYLNGALNLALKPKLWSQLKPGARVVSHYFPIIGWKPDETRVIRDPSGAEVNLFLWRITKEQSRQIASQANRMLKKATSGVQARNIPVPAAVKKLS